MAANPAQKRAAIATLTVLQSEKSGQGELDSSAKAIQAALAQKPGGQQQPPPLEQPQQNAEPAKKKVKKAKNAATKAFADFKRDVTSRLTRIEQLLEQQAIMLRYPAPIYPHMVPPSSNGAVPLPPYSQPPSSRGQTYPQIPPAPMPPPAFPPPYFPPPNAGPSTSQPGGPASSSAPSQGDTRPLVMHPPWAIDDGEPKRRRLFAGHDLRDHRKVSNKRGGRGTKKTCRRCAAEGHENVLLSGHKCPFGENKEKGGVKRANDGSVLNKQSTQPLQGPILHPKLVVAPHGALLPHTAPVQPIIIPPQSLQPQAAVASLPMVPPPSSGPPLQSIPDAPALLMNKVES